jgi:hypothetical protein
MLFQRLRLTAVGEAAPLLPEEGVAPLSGTGWWEAVRSPPKPLEAVPRKGSRPHRLAARRHYRIRHSNVIAGSNPKIGKWPNLKLNLQSK